MLPPCYAAPQAIKRKLHVYVSIEIRTNLSKSISFWLNQGKLVGNIPSRGCCPCRHCHCHCIVLLFLLSLLSLSPFANDQITSYFSFSLSFQVIAASFHSCIEFFPRGTNIHGGEKQAIISLNKTFKKTAADALKSSA